MWMTLAERELYTLFLKRNVVACSALSAGFLHPVYHNTASNNFGTSNMVKVVDLRSDTLTKPTALMKKAMFEAEVGDDVFREDPTTDELERKAASLLGKEAALFVPSGTMANLIAVMVHCEKRGAEMLAGDQSHMVLYEQGAAAQIGGVHTRTLTNKADGTFDLDIMESMIRDLDDHYPTTSLISVENTHNRCGGTVLPLDWLNELVQRASKWGIPLHMDGARLFNAAVHLKVPPSIIVKGFASCSFCLSKNLGAPVGSVLVGSTEFIRKARRVRKSLGGGMRQTGVITAAGIVALDTMIDRLQEDHKHARMIAEAIAECRSKNLHVDLKNCHTNIIIVEVDPNHLKPEEFCQRLAKVTEEEKNVLGEEIVVRILPMSTRSIRFVLRYEITEDDVQAVIRKLKFVLKQHEQ